LSSFAEAKAACEELGGRLPTATELYRVSFPQAGGVGQSHHANYLWALNPYIPEHQIVVRLSDAQVGWSRIDRPSDTLPYRCVCPDANPRAFSEASCHGADEAPCMTMGREGKQYHVDTWDRAPLPVSSAVWECSFSRGRLPQYVDIAEAIYAGLPRGADKAAVWLHTADSAHYEKNTVVRWGGESQTWLPASGTTFGGKFTTFRPFRCLGVSDPIATNSAEVEGEWKTPLSSQKTDGLDQEAKSWHEAHDFCWDRGGHLPRTSELAALIQHGLPGGSDTWLWTADQTGYNDTNFTASVLRWSETQRAFGYYYDPFVSWSYKHGLDRPFRCIYYPVNRQYAGPPAQSCSGSCTLFEPGGNAGAKIWVDTFDRPPKRIGEAIDACRQAGGHLATERDLTEAIRHGLPNGSNSWVWAGDYGNGRITVVRWLDTNEAFEDLWNANMTWSALDELRAYRCAWTNELR
jgi:hypothetical protein